MSLHVYLEDTQLTEEECVCNKCDHVHTHEYYENCYEANITHNLVSMAGACGLYDCMWCPDDNNMVYAKDLIPHLKKGIECLIRDKRILMKYEPTNGWGSYTSLLIFSKQYLKACEEFPESRVRVSR